MEIIEQVNDDLKAAMKAREALRLSTLRMFSAALKNKQIELKADKIKNGQAVQVLKNEIKKRQDAITAYRAGQREELAQKENEEMEILKGYLPAQLDEASIEAKAREVVSGLGDVGSGDFGRVMGAVMARVKGQADGNMVSRIVKRVLAGE